MPIFSQAPSFYHPPKILDAPMFLYMFFGAYIFVYFSAFLFSLRNNFNWRKCFLG